MKKIFTIGLTALTLSACGSPSLEEQVLSAMDDTVKQYEALFSQEKAFCLTEVMTELNPSSEKLESLVEKLETNTDGNPPENIKKKLLEFERKLENLMKDNIGKINQNC